MILRIWRGRTAPADAAAYEELLGDEVLPGIAAETGPGFRGYEVGRREREDTVEFVTVIRFATWDAVEAFAGENVEAAHVPPAARALLTDYEDRVEHYEVVERDGG